MKGFALDEHGDVVIQNGEIQMVYGANLTAQTVKSVLSTQKGEWFLDANEGINRDNILGKKAVISEKSTVEKQYIREITTLKQTNADNEAEMSALNEKLARRLDGVT